MTDRSQQRCAATAGRFDPAARHALHADDVAYATRDGATLLARVYRPRAPGPWPALVDVHGGAWCHLDRRIDANIAEGLAVCGMVVVSLDFRQGGARFPASIRDVLDGIRWVRANAASLDAVPDSIGITGNSSGGHLALLAAICPREPEFQEPPPSGVPAAVAYALPLWPIADPLARYRYLEPLLAGFEKRDVDPFFDPAGLRAAHETHFEGEAAMARAAIPRILRAREFQSLPPIWVAHPEHDRNVTRAMSEELVAAYREAGGSAELEVFDGVGHAFANFPGPAADRCIERMRTFVAGRLGAVPA
jgi:acetyl esterase/lipase